MILADTSVWIDHFRKKDLQLSGLLEKELVCIHPFIIGEIALGNLRNRTEIISLLLALPQVLKAQDEEMLLFIENHMLFGKGIGYIDVHILASALIANVNLWTKDKKLLSIYRELIKE